MNKLKYIINRCVILCIVILSSCGDNHIINDIYVDYPFSNNDSTSISNGSKQTYRVSFTAMVDEVVTKTTNTTPLQASRYVTIYTFIYMNDYVTTKSYQTAQAGLLSPVDGDILSIPDGSYEFYALSVGNKPVYPPTVTDFSTGFATPLSNGIDYLSAQLTNESISGNTTIPLTFSHACSQIMIKIVPEDASLTTLDSITSATISAPSTTSLFLSLFTGRISQSRALSSTAETMYISGDTCHQILLPLTYTGDLTMNFSAIINGEKEARDYSVKIPLVDDTLAAGSSYLYEIFITSSSVNFNSVNVKDWTEVNETGTPISSTVSN